MSLEPIAPRLRLEGVSHGYPLGRRTVREVLDGVSLTVAAGEFVAVLGPSGSGKSTLFDIIAGLRPPTAGRVESDGVSIIGSTRHAAYMPQKDLLFPWRTILQNVTLGLQIQGVPRREAEARARKLIPRFGLSGFEESAPAELSGGMRQRAALLRTVLQERPLLLLDEPFGALDSLTRLQMQNWLQGVWAEHTWTALLVTHDIREAIYLADRVIVLSPRPATVLADISVGLARPRVVDVLTTPEFARIESQILHILHGSVAALD